MRKIRFQFKSILFGQVSAILGLAILLAGCGGSDGGGRQTPTPIITSFVSASSTITAGSSTDLTAVFSNGTGSINSIGSVISGTSVSVTPTTTTTYTITVTNSRGAIATSTVTVTVIPVPSDLTVNVGIDQTIILADTLNLNATATKNGLPPQGVVSYSWSMVSGSGNASFTDANVEDTSVTFDAIGSYVLNLMVDDDGEIVNDTLEVTVNLKAAGGNGLVSRPSNTTECIAPATPPVASSILLEDTYHSLPTLTQPIAMYMAPGDNTNWYVVQQSGQVIKFANNAAVNSVSTFIDINDGRVDTSGWETGLLGMAFHPDFATNGYVYLSYVNNTSGRESRISRFSLNGQVLDPASEVIILEVPQPAINHNGGQIAFGPDGYLYIGFGDGGGGGDTYGNGQNTNTILGAMLRIDVADGTSGSYTIPASNPFAVNGGAPEIFAYGLRNPWRWSFDRNTGQLWAGDVGQGAYEEIDIITNGSNYGWNVMEGTHCYNDLTESCDQTGLTLPVAEYPNPGSAAVTGGYVYRGSDVPFLQGHYLYADYMTGRIWGLEETGTDVYTSTELLDTTFNISSFAEDHNGELYIINIGGSIHKIAEDTSSQVGQIPALLSGWGCFQAGDTKAFSSSVIPYDINALLWADNANKGRFMAIPDGTTIDIDNQGRFDFPVGSVVGKHFYLNGQIIETRLLLHHSQPYGWKGYSYEWNAVQTDATLLNNFKDKDFSGQLWHYPSRAECDTCHTAIAGFTLGPEIGQLNRSFLYPSSGDTANQLVTLENISVLSNTLSDTEKATTFYAIDDSAYSSERRARSYLHSNCAGCHQPAGPGGGNLDLRMATSMEDTGICNVAASGSWPGIANPVIVSPGDSGNSILVLRMEDIGSVRMPPLGTMEVDTVAMLVIKDWIDDLSGCP